MTFDEILRRGELEGAQVMYKLVTLYFIILVIVTEPHITQLARVPAIGGLSSAALTSNRMLQLVLLSNTILFRITRR